jgi:hypothetical protein
MASNFLPFVNPSLHPFFEHFLDKKQIAFKQKMFEEKKDKRQRALKDKENHTK